MGRPRKVSEHHTLLQTRIPYGLWDWLRRQAHDRDVTVADFVRLILTERMEADQAQRGAHLNLMELTYDPTT